MPALSFAWPAIGHFCKDGAEVASLICLDTSTDRAAATCAFDISLRHTLADCCQILPAHLPSAKRTWLDWKPSHVFNLSLPAANVSHAVGEIYDARYAMCSARYYTLPVLYGEALRLRPCGSRLVPPARVGSLLRRRRVAPRAGSRYRSAGRWVSSEGEGKALQVQAGRPDRLRFLSRKAVAGSARVRDPSGSDARGGTLGRLRAEGCAAGHERPSEMVGPVDVNQPLALVVAARNGRRISRRSIAP